MTVYAWVITGVCAVLVVSALLTGNLLQALGSASVGTSAVLGGFESRRREAERQAAFAQRLRAARREPQAVVVVRRAAAGCPARLVPLWVDVDGEARARLTAGTEESLPVPAGERTVVTRRPWSSGRTVTVAVATGASATVEA